MREFAIITVYAMTLIVLACLAIPVCLFLFGVAIIGMICEQVSTMIFVGLNGFGERIDARVTYWKGKHHAR